MSTTTESGNARSPPGKEGTNGPRSALIAAKGLQLATLLGSGRS